MKTFLSRLLLCGLGLLSVHSVANDSRDPTRPPVVSSRARIVREPAPILSAIMGAPSGRIAIFNGQLVHAGSIVGGFLIEAVLDDGVRYRHAGTTQELHMAHSIHPIKKPSAATARLPAGAP